MDVAEVTDVLRQVKAWEPEMRIKLARRILESLEEPQISDPPRSMSSHQVFGILKTDSLPPNDEECVKNIKEERLRKYG